MNPITLDHAQTIITGALGAAADAEMQPLCVVVLDAGGHMVSCARQDGVAFGRVDVAFSKAFGAISIGLNSRTLEAAAVARPHFIAGVIGAVGGSVVPVAGGVVVLDADGNRVGSVGASGDNSDNDEIAVLAGIAAAGLTAAS
jgi:uncharacterized protein GlcG (DUF336 family)